MTKVEWEDVQGIAINGYGDLEKSRYLFLHFPQGFEVHGWLCVLERAISTVTGEGRLGVNPRVAINVAFTWEGLAVLRYPAAERVKFAPEFIAGMADPERARRLGDSGASHPKRWEIGNPSAPLAIHALLILKADDEAELDKLQKEYTAGVDLAADPQPGWTDRLDHREHFGFSDGISQPVPKDSPPPRVSSSRSRQRQHQRSPSVRNDRDIVPTGEFVLGYLNAYTMFPSTPTVPESCDPHGLLPEMVHAKDQQQRRKDFGRNGTYLVFRKLAQHVGLFRDFLTQNAPPGGQDLLAAKLVGRWASGAPLTLHPTRDPGIASNDFGYHKKDRNGFQCPIGAHIRRANPRDDLEHDSQQSVLTVERHRILRRGVLYGPRLLEGKPDDGQPRGLLFICLNADIRRQFEFIQQTWLNNPKFAGLHNDRDPIVGANREPGQPPKGRYEMIIQQETVRKRLRDLPRFVTMRGGGYFFLPGIKALRFLISLKPDHVSVPTEPFADTSGD